MLDELCSDISYRVIGCEFNDTDATVEILSYIKITIPSSC